MKKRSLLIVLFLLFVLLMVGCKKDKPIEQEPQEHTHLFGEWQEVVAASCYTDGIMERTCECGKVETQSIQGGHKWTQGTCMKKSVCEICGEKGEYEDHNYSEWEVLLEPECVSTGLKTHKCSWCGKVETVSIPSLEHNYSEWKILQNSTCTEEGLREHTCSVGGEVVREKIPVIDHSFSEWEVLTEPTCTVEGVQIHHCVSCGLEEVETIDFTEHLYSEWNITKDPTCDQVGVKTHECSICHNIEEQIIAKTEHNFELIGSENVCSECHEKESTHSVIQSAIEQVSLVIDPDKTEGLVLPTSLLNVSITWKSINPNIITDEGVIYASSFKRTAIMVGTFTYNGEQEEASFEVEVPVMDVSTHNYCWNVFYSKKVVDQTAANLVFITKPYGDCTVVGYESSNPEVITSKGVISQKLYKQTASITCHLRYGNVISTHTKSVDVLPFTDTQVLEIVEDWVPTMIEKLQNGEIDYLPCTDEVFGTTISWFCMEPGIIAGNGVFVKPSVATNLELKCTIVFKQQNRQLTFNLTNIGGNMSKLDQLKEWIKGQIPTRIMGTKNFVLDNDALDYQIRTNSGGVLNLIDGSNPSVDRSLLIDVTKNTWVNRFFGSGKYGIYHPVVTQDILNQMMYEGYKNPNEQNILWITVHESGMPRTANDALLLAQVQMDTATGKRDRQASWNYQVDEKMIYQSFEDEVICWHAGDGTVTLGNGNNNSIGIEMCINDDGNYDGAMYHDAKLIAMLLHKYNLSLVNVKRHFDWSGKICPNYMITQGRWYEFLSLVDKEYTAMSLLKDAKVTWEVTTDDNNNTEEVLAKYFNKAASTIYLSKPVSEEVTLHITMTVEYENETFTHSGDLTLYPDK